MNFLLGSDLISLYINEYIIILSIIHYELSSGDDTHYVTYDSVLSSFIDWVREMKISAMFNNFYLYVFNNQIFNHYTTSELTFQKKNRRYQNARVAIAQYHFGL